MKKTSILYIGRNAEILETVLRIIDKNEDWTGYGALTDEEAKKIFSTTQIHIVLLGNGINETCENELKAYFNSVNSNIPVIQHYGGGSGLLYSEITAALA